MRSFPSQSRHIYGAIAPLFGAIHCNWRDPSVAEKWALSNKCCFPPARLSASQCWRPINDDKLTRPSCYRHSRVRTVNNDDQLTPELTFCEARSMTLVAVRH
jgi:hypothetical protein